MKPGPKPIIDEFSARTDLSRQRRSQLRWQRDGKCIICGALRTGNATRCEKHRRSLNLAQRELFQKRNPGARRNLNSESYHFETNGNGAIAHQNGVTA